MINIGQRYDINGEYWMVMDFDECDDVEFVVLRNGRFETVMPVAQFEEDLYFHRIVPLIIN